MHVDFQKHREIGKVIMLESNFESRAPSEVQWFVKFHANLVKIKILCSVSPTSSMTTFPTTTLILPHILVYIPRPGKGAIHPGFSARQHEALAVGR